MSPRRLSRRAYMRLAVLRGAGAPLGACMPSTALPATMPEEEGPEAGVPPVEPTTQQTFA